MVGITFICNQEGLEEGPAPENRLKIIGASATVCVCVRAIAGGRDGRQGCKGEEVARKQGRKKNIDALFVVLFAQKPRRRRPRGNEKDRATQAPKAL